MKNVITTMCLTLLLACHQQQATDFIGRHGIYFDSTDVRDISYLKNTSTGAPVVATKTTWKAWSNDVELYLSPGDTVDWVRMEVLFAE